jgi:aldose sugar dehydrogenase
MMDIAVHPDYLSKDPAKAGWIYFAFNDTATPPARGTMTRIARARLDPSSPADKPAWKDLETIWQAKQEHYLGGGLHFGCRIAFTEPNKDGKRYVYWSIGERGRGDMAQDVARPNGKVHRLFDDGTQPPDNPFVGKADAYESIWSYGHRNPQGLAFALDGELWDTEHGPRGGDELNHVLKGRNYGWPIIAFSINYQGTPYRTPWPDTIAEKDKTPESADFVLPVDRWLPSIGACGFDVMRPASGEHAGKDAFPKWKGDFFAGGLSGANVDRIRVTKDSTGSTGYVSSEHENLLRGIGRVRDVVCSPHGYVYVVLNDPDHVWRLVPSDAKAE